MRILYFHTISFFLYEGCWTTYMQTTYSHEILFEATNYYDAEK